MKTFLVLILSTLLISSTFANYTCGSNPLLTQVSDLFSTYSEHFEDQEVANTLNTAITMFSLLQPSVKSSLEFCSDFEGQNTCCSSLFTGNIPKVIDAVYEGLREQELLSSQLIDEVLNKINVCGGAQAAVDFFSSDLQTLADTYFQCRNEEIESVLKLVGGTLCGICIPPQQIDNYFENADQDDFEVLVNQVNYEEFTSSIASTIQCFKDSNTQFIPAFKAKLTTLPQECTSVNTEYANQIETLLTVPETCTPGILTEECAKIFVASNTQRILQDVLTPSYKVVSDGGLSAYKEDAVEANQVQVPTTKYAKQYEEESKTKPEVKKENEENQSASILAVSFIGLVALLF